MPNEIHETVIEELGEQNPIDATVPEDVVQDDFFLKAVFPQFLKCFGLKGPIAACSRAALLAFQGGMLYERARQKKHSLSPVSGSKERSAVSGTRP